MTSYGPTHEFRGSSRCKRNDCRRSIMGMIQMARSIPNFSTFFRFKSPAPNSIFPSRLSQLPLISTQPYLPKMPTSTLSNSLPLIRPYTRQPSTPLPTSSSSSSSSSSSAVRRRAMSISNITVDEIQATPHPDRTCQHVTRARADLDYQDSSSLAAISSTLPRAPVSDSFRSIDAMLSHAITIPRLPTGSISTRFMKSALASNVPLIAVCGGLSYLGSHVVARHLALGHFVRALTPQGADSSFLTRLPGAQSRLQVVPIRDPSAIDALPVILAALRGVSTVVHATSFSTHNGVRSKHSAARKVVDALKIALDAANTPGNVVTNFIYLSSESTVFDPSLLPPNAAVHLTELDWYDCSKASRELSQPFAYAHTVAEMRLWARVSKRSLPFSVCSVIPALLLGPALSTRHTIHSPYVTAFKHMLTGALQQVPDFPYPVVDVRDVADAVASLSCQHSHRVAAGVGEEEEEENDGSGGGSAVRRHDIGGRILLSATDMTAGEFMTFARNEFPFYPWTNVVTKEPLLTRSKSRRRYGQSSYRHSQEYNSDTQLDSYSHSYQCASSSAVGLRFTGCAPPLTARKRFGFAAVKGDPVAVRMFKDYEFTAKERLGKRYAFSQGRATQELGMKFRPLKQTIDDTIKSLYEHGALPRTTIRDT